LPIQQSQFFYNITNLTSKPAKHSKQCKKKTFLVARRDTNTYLRTVKLDCHFV